MEKGSPQTVSFVALKMLVNIFFVSFHPTILFKALANSKSCADLPACLS